MFKKFRIHEKYIIRHKLLEHLAKRANHKNLITMMNDLNKTNIPFYDVAKEMKIDYDKLYLYHHIMHHLGNNQIKCTVQGKVHYVGLNESGLAAYSDGYWLREGRKELNDRIYDTVKWVAPIAAVLISLLSITLTLSTIQQNQDKVELLEGRLQELSQQIKRFSPHP